MDQVVEFSEHPTRDGRRIMAARLNAPRSLNALSLEMIRLLQPRLDEWAADPQVAAVWLEGAGERAFCAGGDVLALYRAMAEGKPADGDSFFSEEYRLDYSIHTYPKPLIVWGNGIVMGGGLGLMAGASFRIATENSHIAMPEIGIGLFPDVGASWFLNRMPGRTGLFVGLTGAALNAADALFLGLADRFITHEQRDSTFTLLADADWGGAQTDAATVNRVLRECERQVAEQVPDSPLRKHLDQIQALTDADSTAQMVEQLSSYPGDDSWLNKAAKSIARGSPTSVALCCEQLRRARHASLAEVFDQELVMAGNALRSGEFAEGVRALLVDKDKQPRWRYSNIADVEDSWIEHFFVPPWPNGPFTGFLTGSSRPLSVSPNSLTWINRRTTMARITFIGLGNMGQPMAKNLLKAGHELTVFDLSAPAVKAMVEAGAKDADSLAAAVASAEFVVTMLPAGKHVESVYLDAGGLLESVAEGTLLIDCSTIAPETAQRVAQAASEKQLSFMDAPVSGGVGGAQAGTLTFICGGENAIFDRVQALLQDMGKNIFHAGPHGAGQVGKICNNMLLAILMAGTSEALALGVKNGLDPAVLSEIMKQSSGGNWALNVYNPWPGVMENVPASRDYEGGFLVRLMNKDLGLAFDNAVKNEAAIPLGSLARNLFALHAQQGNGGLDFSSIQRFYRGNEEGGAQ